MRSRDLGRLFLLAELLDRSSLNGDKHLNGCQMILSPRQMLDLAASDCFRAARVVAAACKVSPPTAFSMQQGDGVNVSVYFLLIVSAAIFTGV